MSHSPSDNNLKRYPMIFYIPILILVLSIILAGRINSRTQVHLEPPSRKTQWSDLCRSYAMLSYAVYFNPQADPNLEGDGGNKLADQFRQVLEGEGWKCVKISNRITDKENGPSKDWVDGEGLYYEIWHNAKSTPQEYVFAFRGTNAALLSDWASNFRWFRWINFYRRPDQYDTAASDCVTWFKENIPDPKGVRIVTTGHSLGGGIAQHVFYALAPDADQAIVFDPSPVTGFFDFSKRQEEQYLSLPYRAQFAPHRIVRAYADGEILAYFRNALAPFVGRNP